jgi:ribose transport system permease protein
MRGNRLTETVSGNKLLGIMALIVAVMAILAPDFFSASNIINTISYLSVNGILSIGITLVMIGGFIDMSVGSIVGLAGAIAIITVNRFGPTAAILVGSLSGILMGLANGLIVTKMKINAFIATLGTMIVFQGMAFAITNTKAIMADSEAFQSFALARVLSIPIIIFYFVAVCLIFWFISRFTTLGKNAYAIGGNIEACRSMGIKTDRTVIVLFVLSGVCASFAGVLLSSKISAASGRFGETVIMTVIASVVLGGVSLSGGVGKVSGVIQGIILVGLLENATVYLGFYDFWQAFFRSILLLLVLVVDVVSMSIMNKRLQKRELKLAMKG